MTKRQIEEVPILKKNPEREEGEDPLQFPDDPRPGWAKEDVENEGRKPNLGELDEDPVES